MNSETQLHIEESEETADADAIGPARAAGLLETLGIARIVVGSSAGGMLVVQVVLAVVGLLMLLLAGKLDGVHAFASVLPVTVVFAAGGWSALRWLDNRIISLIQRVKGPQMCLPMLEMLAAGLPLGRIRPHLEESLCASLALVNEEWWDQNARLIKKHAGKAIALGTATKPAKYRSLDGQWIPALLDAIERCGRTEMLRKVERLQAGSKRAPLPAELTENAKRCAESLRDRIKRDNEAATLLRSAARSDNMLLRAVSGCETVQADLLLRPSADISLVPTPAEARAGEATQEALQLNR